MENTESAIDQSKVIKQQRDLLDRWNIAMGWCTPGGSEYIDDPERCKEAIRHRYDSFEHMKDVMWDKHRSIVAEKDKRIAELEAQLAEASNSNF